MSMSTRIFSTLSSFLLVIALFLPLGVFVPVAFADEAGEEMATSASAEEDEEASADGESDADDSGSDAEGEDSDEEESADEEGSELSTEGSSNTGVTEYNAEGQEVTSDVTDDADDLAAQIFLDIVAVLAVVGLIYLLVWYLRSYRPRRAVQRKAAAAAVTPVPAGEPIPSAPAEAASPKAATVLGEEGMCADAEAGED